ncbi:hypothetical protein AAG570_007746 [Ranatra chinensis]|uniref:Uncharacterized protein n=1 Tax=Ranatra chinensis TaxID=642074 RepID=A0ABD0XUN6_9HEMI
MRSSVFAKAKVAAPELEVTQGWLPLDERSTVDVKKNASAILREAAAISKVEQSRTDKLLDLLSGAANYVAYENFESELQVQRYMELVKNVEKKHLLGLISFEEARLSKKRLFKENQERRKQFELEKRIELDKKIEVIREIRALNALKKLEPKVYYIPKPMSYGSLCTMSTTELNERLKILKTDLKNELEMKKQAIAAMHNDRQMRLRETESFIADFREEER